MIDARWEMYRDFIAEHEEYQNIFVTDVRDVVFQSDLFANYANLKSFWVYSTEAANIKNPIPYADGTFNWIRHLFGEQELERLQDKIIVCCGTVLGSREEMKIFIDAMIDILKRSTRWGDEQAAMNYLVHNNLLPIDNIIESSVKTGDILTAGIVQNPQVDNEKILRGDGKIPAAVHQYDRHPALIQLVDKLYRAKDFPPNEIFIDTQSAIDQVFCLVQRQNWNAATKFFVNHVLYSNHLQRHGGRILKVCQLIFKNYSPNAEILFLAMQKTLEVSFSQNVDIRQVESLYKILASSDKNPHVLAPSFRNFVGTLLINFANLLYKDGRLDWCSVYLERLSNAEFKLNKDMYLLKAKIYRELGKKAEALKAYEQALDAN